MQRFRLLLRLLSVVKNPRTYLLHARGKIAGSHVTYELRSGMNLLLRTHSSDRHVFNDIWLDEVYAKEGISWDRLQTVVDIGAHAGFFACYAAARAPAARIVSFEPEPSNVGMFRANVERNRLQERVVLDPAGVAGQDGTLRLHVTPGREESHSAHRQGENSVPLDVPVISLEHALTKHNVTHCDLMKINCEGEEYELLYALPPVYFQHIDFLLINYHLFSPDPAHHPSRLIAFLEQQGYEVVKHPHEIITAKRKAR